MTEHKTISIARDPITLRSEQRKRPACTTHQVLSLMVGLIVWDEKFATFNEFHLDVCRRFVHITISGAGFRVECDGCGCAYLVSPPALNSFIAAMRERYARWPHARVRPYASCPGDADLRAAAIAADVVLLSRAIEPQGVTCD